MTRFLLGRVLSLVLSLVGASLAIFAAVEVIPGDPAAFMLGLNAEPEAVAALRRELGLDGSLIERYLSWAGGLLTGDFGVSYRTHEPVLGAILSRLPEEFQ